MKTSDRIMNFASQQSDLFRRADIMNALASSNESRANIAMQLNRLVSSGRLSRVGYGVYSLPLDFKKTFTYQPSDNERRISKLIKEKFPFTDFCVWNSSVVTSFMQHVPASHIIFVDVERVAMDSVFSFLQSCDLNIPVLINPTKSECERYISIDDIIIVRPLVNEAPCDMVDDYSVPTLEKVLVDAIGDKELAFMQGAEMYSIYKNAFDSYEVNKSRLLRYASRRNRKELVSQILKTENL